MKSNSKQSKEEIEMEIEMLLYNRYNNERINSFNKDTISEKRRIIF